MRHNVTTPGGFFVGLGGIAAFCAVAVGVYCWGGKPAATNELEPQKLALGLSAKPTEDDKKLSIDTFLSKAATHFNGGKKLNLDNIDDLRGAVRFRESDKSRAEALSLLNANSSIEGKNVLQAAMLEVAKEIASKKPAASTVKVDLIPAAPENPVSMPNLQGGGAHTVTFPQITPTPTQPAEAPAKPQASISEDSSTVASLPAPNRNPLFNWSDSK